MTTVKVISMDTSPTMRTKATQKTDDGIIWYYEQEGSGDDIVLIPDGIGDCQEFDRAVTLLSGHEFRVTTFDTPGMSRSSDAPTETYANVTSEKLATQIIGLMDKLQIDVATFWGSSSGGATVLALCANYPSRVRGGLVHEVPMGDQPFFASLSNADDDFISKTVAGAFAGQFPGDAESWGALGKEFHARLYKNYPRWVKGYGHTLTTTISTTKEDLTRRPINWTIGRDSPTHMFLHNAVHATRAGIKVDLLPGTHFPYIFDPQAFAKYVADQVTRGL